MNKIYIQKAKFLKNTCKVSSFCSLSKKKKKKGNCTADNLKDREEIRERREKARREIDPSMSYLSIMSKDSIF